MLVPIFPDSALDLAWAQLDRTACSLVPVMSRNGEYVGVVRRSALHRSEAPGAGSRLDSGYARSDYLAGQAVRELLTRFPYAVDLRAPILAAKEALDEAAVGCVPVVDGVRLVGFVTSVEVLQAFFDLGSGDSVP